TSLKTTENPRPFPALQRLFFKHTITSNIQPIPVKSKAHQAHFHRLLSRYHHFAEEARKKWETNRILPTNKE
ncbi:MAG: hypothetical protein WCJ57_04695, partial [Candidatus Falkowbacteria bacterium]